MVWFFIGMDKDMIERREFPRVTARFPIKISPEFLGETVDLSETGLRFVLEKPLLLSKAQVKIELSPEESVETEFKIIWNKHLVNEGKFAYGVAFIRMGGKGIDLLRNIVIRSEIGHIISKISDKDAQKNIEQFFIHDLMLFMEYMDELQKNEINWQPDKQGALDTYSHKVVAKGNSLIEKIEDRRVQKAIKATFRRLAGTASLPYKSSLMKHSLDKPYGYPGDYDLIEKIYDNRPVTEWAGKYFDMIFLNNPYACAVRSRKDKMKGILKDFIIKAGFEPINILNFGCGSCREIRELFINDAFMTEKEIHFDLLDQDKNALQYSRQMLSDRIGNIRFNYIEADALTFSRSSVYKNMLGRMHLIYSIGLADYLPDRILKSIVQEYFELITNGGEFVVAHKDITKDPHAPIFPDWFCDWHFISRSEEGLTDLISRLKLKKMVTKLGIENTGKIIFLHICRQGE